jgi:spermidine/putrescine transport system permease protein
MLLPELVIGISLLIWFVIINFSLGKISLIISHVTFTLPYAVILLTLAIEGIDKSLFEAAKDLGANNNQIFIKLTLPMLKPSLFGVFLLSFVISFDDFLISYFTAGAGNDTLPIKLYALMRFGLSNELKAISTIILISSIALTALLIKILISSVDKHSQSS